MTRKNWHRTFAEIGELGDVRFSCVGTPQPPGGHADLSYVETVHLLGRS